MTKSANHVEQESSLETQISYYGKFISECECWQLVKIYAEQASGTQTKASRVYENDQGLVIMLCKEKATFFVHYAPKM